MPLASLILFIDHGSLLVRIPVHKVLLLDSSKWKGQPARIPTQLVPVLMFWRYSSWGIFPIGSAKG